LGHPTIRHLKREMLLNPFLKHCPECEAHQKSAPQSKNRMGAKLTEVHLTAFGIAETFPEKSFEQLF